MEVAAENNFGTHFYVGRYRIEDTSFVGFCCGMFALRISTQTQLGIQLTEQDFFEIYNSNEMQDFNKRKGYVNVKNNFFDDQLAFVLLQWGARHGLDNLQLGLIVEQSFCAVLGKDDKYLPILSESDTENEGEFKTVWIHNNNLMEISGELMNHFSGVSILEDETSMDEVAKGKRDAGEEEQSDIENDNAAPHSKRGRMDHEIVSEAPKYQSEDENVDEADVVEADEVEDNTDPQHLVEI